VRYPSTIASLKALNSPDSYTIPWIAALPIERAAGEAMLHEEHAAPTSFSRHQTDANVNTWGRMGERIIVIASPGRLIRRLMAMQPLMLCSLMCSFNHSADFWSPGMGYLLILSLAVGLYRLVLGIGL
jgi:hypothetical protein